MPPVSKVLGNDAKVDPMMVVKWYMLMQVVQDWHTRLTGVRPRAPQRGEDHQGYDVLWLCASDDDDDEDA